MADSNYPIHPAATMFPRMTDEEFAGLKEDIRKNGLKNPIVTWKNAVIDGRYRLRACLQLNIKPQFTQLSDEADPVAYVVSCNLHRRHLTTSQRASIAARLATLKVGMNQHSITKLPTLDSSSSEVLQNCNTSNGSSLTEAASMLNVSKRAVSSASHVQEHGCSTLIAYVDSGEITVSLAEAFCKTITDPKERTEIARRGPGAIRRTLHQTSELPPDSPSEQVRKLKSIIKQHIIKAVRAVDELDNIKPNRAKHQEVIKLLKSVQLW